MEHNTEKSTLPCESNFYMLFVEGGSSPSYKHQTYDDAVREAQRLAAKTMRPVYILNATEKITAEYQFQNTTLIPSCRGRAVRTEIDLTMQPNYEIK